MPSFPPFQIINGLELVIKTGIIEDTTPIAPLVSAASTTTSLQRHFSSFTLTSHLHAPLFRLVSLHPLLSFNLLFLRVPEVHDGYEYKLFVSRSMKVNEVIEGVVDELGLARSSSLPGGGNLEYVLEEVWVLDDLHSML